MFNMPDMLIQTIRVLWFLIFYMNKEKKHLFEILLHFAHVGNTTSSQEHVLGHTFQLAHEVCTKC